MGICSSLALCVGQMACCAVCSATNCLLSRVAKFGYFAIFVGSVILASVLRETGYNMFPSEAHQKQATTWLGLPAPAVQTQCGFDSDRCVGDQLVYRVTLAGFALFAGSGLFSLLDVSAHYKAWPFKLLVLFSFLIGSLWIDNRALASWGELALVLSFFWLLLQAFLVLDFCYDIHELLMQTIDSAEMAHEVKNARVLKMMYLVGSAASFVTAFIGVVLLFRDYDCPFANFLTSVTLISGLVGLGASTLDRVNVGVLTPNLAFLFTSFLSWSALSSSPDANCNYQAMSLASGSASALPSMIVATIVCAWTAWHGSKVLQLFNPEGQGLLANASPAVNTTTDWVNGGARSRAMDPGLRSLVTGGAVVGDRLEGSGAGDDDDDDDGGGGRGGGSSSVIADADPQLIRKDLCVFHGSLALAMAYSASVLTSWDDPSSSLPGGLAPTHRVGNEALWFKVVSLWFFISLFFRTLYVCWQNNSP